MGNIKLAITLATEAWGLLICLICTLIMMFYGIESKKDVCVRRLLIISMVLLVNDICVWCVDGRPGMAFRVLGYASNTIMYICNYTLTALYIAYVWQIVCDGEVDKRAPIRYRVFWGFITLLSVYIIIGCAFGLVFYLDGANIYHRTTGFGIAQSAVAIGCIFLTCECIRYIKRMNMFERIASFSFFVLPAIATVFQLKFYGYPFQTISMVIASLITFFVREADVREQLDVARNSAIKANKAKTLFLNNISHDIRTPMNAIMGFTKLMERDINNSNKLIEYIGKINTSGYYLIELINNVLDMASIEGGKLTINEGFCDIETNSAQINDMLKSLVEKHNITYTCDINTQNRYFYGDEVKLKQIYMNILSNAIKYTPDGGSVSLKVSELDCDKEGYTTYQSIITDTGIGISEEYLPHIFDLFSRERNTTEGKVVGTGLGMSIVKKLVELMGGNITVDSVQNKGTTVTITTTHKIVADPTQYITDGARYIIPDHSFDGKRLLVAEDNALNAEIATAILTEEGFEVDITENGLICLQEIEAKPATYYDAILMDIQMPQLDGYATTERIRALDDSIKANIPIIAMTANALDEDKRKAVEVGMNGHVAKPINIDKLLLTLFNVIEKGKEA